ncbi:MAG: pimeloyl-ACP methyl ester carboxylesterase [Candidatus Pelagisphaera sp.]|jgi:pimeloyl-ACP methyl ester carboxylesterase
MRNHPLILSFTLVLLSLPLFAESRPQQPSSWKEGYVTTNEIRIHYWRTGGDKPPLIMTHGFSDHGLCWTSIAQELTDRFDVILPDARGHGHSDPPSKSEAADAQVEDIAGLIKALNLKKPIILGHSMGSSSAAWFAARYPNIPQATILVDPRLVSRAPAESNSRNSATAIEKRVASIIKKNNASYEDLINGQMKQNPHWGITELHFWALSKQIHHPYAAYTSTSERPQMSELFTTITSPTLILKADDQGDLRQKNETVAAILQDGQLVHIEGARHSVHRDQKQRFMNALNSFLARIQR